ncbi:MAG TPA: FHA domain-containing protein [Pirellulaceae bacterium]|nr:FHA domain-containing protein [Pirellulaceae bacterium]HMO94046.1 FHA domain-containing protein [Pirellulaceae bacterium]HMP70916.1 FHA domain-containing protein [Pirellulaceae bacterium]
MQVKLKVRGGKHEGREIALTVPEFVIGRGDEAHLRPSSDLVSRRHCSIKVTEGKVIVADLGSRNGTYVNDTLLEKPHEAAPGDLLRIGKLEFELVIDVAKPSAKKPKVADIADAIARTQIDSSKKEGVVDEDSIFDWLSQPNESKALQETNQFRFEETSTKLFIRSTDIEAQEGATKGSGELPESVSSVSEPKSGKFNKKKPGKLPERPKQVAESSKGAADDVLRKFFNRR